MQQPAWNIEGQILKDEKQAQGLIEQLQYQEQARVEQEKINARQAMTQQGLGIEAALPEIPVREIQVEQVTYSDLAQNKAIEVVQVLSTKIHQCVIIGDKLLYKRILPIEHYPIVPFINIHTRTPYPVSDVRLVKGMQEYINKTR